MESIFSSLKAVKGHVKVWKVHRETGEKKLVVDKDNLVLKQGAKLLALALSGAPSSKIDLMYIGFNNNESFTLPTVDTDYSQPFNQLSTGAGFGFLREPLTFPAAYLSTSTYSNNVVVFTTMISSATAFYGNAFTSGVSQIYGCALVAPGSTNPVDDVVFSQINFDQIEYDSNFNLVISWGVEFLT